MTNARSRFFAPASLVATALIGCTAPVPAEGRGSTESRALGNARSIGRVRVTHYTLAREADFASEEDFLCSGRGVAMQGTGIRRDGSYVTYVSGGGGWCGDYAYLCSCGSATFRPSPGPVGASGRIVKKNYSIAVDPGVIPLGSYVWLESLGRWYRADDTGGGVDGMHIDVYTGEDDPSLPESSDAYVTNEPHGEDEAGPSGQTPRPSPAGPTPQPSTSPRPAGGSFEPLDVRAPVREGGYVTQCSDAGGEAGSEQVWQASSGGKNASSRWAVARYPQMASGGCGSPSGGVYPLVLRSEGGGSFGGTWITQCRREKAGQARVFRVESANVDGHPAASYLYTEEDASCAK
ncbi:MAG: 3D domain-containing protein [Labilithrix sp.]